MGCGLDGGQGCSNFFITVNGGDGAGVVARDPVNKYQWIGRNCTLGVVRGHRAIAKDQLVKLILGAASHYDGLLVSSYCSGELQFGAAGQCCLGVFGPIAAHVNQVRAAAQVGGVHGSTIGDIDSVDTVAAGDGEGNAGAGGGKGLADLAGGGGACGKCIEHGVQWGSGIGGRAGCWGQ